MVNVMGRIGGGLGRSFAGFGSGLQGLRLSWLRALRFYGFFMPFLIGEISFERGSHGGAEVRQNHFLGWPSGVETQPIPLRCMCSRSKSCLIDSYALTSKR
jgi:hypothetical protein